MRGKGISVTRWEKIRGEANHIGIRGAGYPGASYNWGPSVGTLILTWTFRTRVAVGVFALLMATGCSAVPDEPATVEERPPNVVILFADDLGFGDLGVYGHPTIRTPNLDQMAAEGQKWTNFYVGAPVCSPSRAALLTGRLPVRSGMYGTRERTRVLFPDTPSGISADETTLAEALGARGYATGIFGKWHLGHLPAYLPMAHGFDQWLGLPYSNDMQQTTARDAPFLASIFLEPKSEYWNVPLMRNDEVIQLPADQTQLTRRYTEEAQAFIEANQKQPFFLYVPYTMPHVPLFTDEAFVGASAAGLYGDVIEEIDWSVGQILNTLRIQGLDEQTIVLFTSDNGPWLVYRQQGGSAGLLQQGKATTFEGGMRVPAIFWWPGTISPATVHEIGSTLDVFTTAITLTDGAVPVDRPIDSFDLTPVLLQTGASPRNTMPYYRADELYAMRKGMFKAHFITEGSYGEPPARKEHDPPLLYHLGEDPAERFDVGPQYPGVIADILAEVEIHREGLEIANSAFDLRPPPE